MTPYVPPAQQRYTDPSESQESFLAKMKHQYPAGDVYDRGNNGKPVKSETVDPRGATPKVKDPVSGPKSKKAGAKQGTPPDPVPTPTRKTKKDREEREERRREEEELESSSTTSESSSEETESSEEERPKRRGRRDKSSIPKMETFDGEASKWGSFYFAFKQACRGQRWSERERRDCLLRCLRGKALEYLRNRPR